MDNINDTQNKRPNREGSNNPMWQRHHSSISKQKQSESAKRRWTEIKKMQQHYTTMDELLANNPSVKESISRIIQEEIKKFLWQIQH